MAVEKVSANIPLVNNSVLPMQNGKPIAPSNVSYSTPSVNSQEPKKGNKNVLWWVLGGLAVAGTAGTLIYRARKGDVSKSSEPLANVGTYLKKFLNESIFAKSLESTNKGSKDVELRVSQDRNVWELCDYKNSFVCALNKKVPDDKKGVVPDFLFESNMMQIKIFDQNVDTARFDFSFNDVKLSVDVEPWCGDVKSCSLKDKKETYEFTTTQSKALLAGLDLKKLVDDSSYRSEFVYNFANLVNDIVSKTRFQKIADKSGKTLDEVKEIHKSAAFKDLLTVSQEFMRVHSRYEPAVESETYLALKNKDTYEILDDFINGKSKFNIVSDFVDDNYMFNEDKICYDVIVPTADGKGVYEHFRMDKPNNVKPVPEYILYERFNPDDVTDKLKIRTYFPQDADAWISQGNTVDLETKNASLYLNLTPSGLNNRVEVTNPEKPDETLKFYFNSVVEWDEGIEFGDELQPYMGFIKKFSEKLSNGRGFTDFVSKFLANGKEMLEELAK